MIEMFINVYLPHFFRLVDRNHYYGEHISGPNLMYQGLV